MIDVTGSIEKDKWADMIVLNHNLFEISETEIHKTEIQKQSSKETWSTKSANAGRRDRLMPGSLWRYATEPGRHSCPRLWRDRKQISLCSLPSSFGFSLSRRPTENINIVL